MCVSLGPARFSNTILYVGEAVRNGMCVHVLGYQNTAQNLTIESSSASVDPKLWSQVVKQKGPKPTGNAMILPFPAAKPMSKENVIDTSNCKSILKDIASAVKPQSDDLMMGGSSFSGYAKSVEIFETGIYTVVLARDPRDIPKALEQVPIEKRPDLKPRIFEAYGKWYPGWQIALCCFSNAEAVEADPLLWWYEPADPNVYFAPTLDSHTGGVPDLDAKVDLDHTIAVGVLGFDVNPVTYNDELPEDVRTLLPRAVLGHEYSYGMQNGDFLFLKSVVEAGVFDPHRLTPGDNPVITL